MYLEAVNYHIYAVLLLVITITAFYILTQFHVDFNMYKKKIQSLMPIYFFALTATIFTGIIMMAGKHLEFSLTNNAMIFVSLLLIYLEIIRYKKMKISPISDARYYVAFAKRIYAIELLTLFAVVYIVRAGL